MWKRKNKQVTDERILKESNRLSAKLYYAMVILSVLSLVVKLICRVPWFLMGVEVAALAVSGIYVLIRQGKNGILFLKDKDETLKTIQEEILAKAMSIMLGVMLLGELIFVFVAEEYLAWTLSYLAIWFVPALVYTIVAIKKGLFIWGGKKRETEGKKNFKLRVLIGASFFGVFMGFPMLFRDGVFQPVGILWIIGMAAMWGIPFYLVMTAMMKVSEKAADKQVKEVEANCEE